MSYPTQTVLDSSGKFPPTGILEGTLTDLGRYDECLDVDETLEGGEDEDDDPNVISSIVSTRIQGQYCSVMIRPPLPEKPRFHTLCNQVPSLVNVSSSDLSIFRWLGKNAQYFYYSPVRVGLCTPSQCSPRDIDNMISKMARAFNLTGSVQGMKCDVKTNIPSNVTNRTQVFVLLAFGLMFVLILVGTIFDVYDVGSSCESSSASSSARTSTWHISKTSTSMDHHQSHYSQHELEEMLKKQTLICEFLFHHRMIASSLNSYTLF